MATTKNDVIAAVRRQLDDSAGSSSTNFWSDDDLKDYYIEAVKLFARLTRCIRDSLTDTYTVNGISTDLCLLQVVAGTRHIALSPLILDGQLESAVPSWAIGLAPATRIELDQFQPTWQTDIGYPDKYILDYSDGYLTLNREPVVNGTIRLTIRRMPINPDSSLPEIPNKYLEHLYDYMLFRAFNKLDAEIYNPQKAEAHLIKFRGESETSPGGHCGLVLSERRGFLRLQRSVRTF